MIKSSALTLFLIILFPFTLLAQKNLPIKMEVVREFSLGQEVGQVRAVPVKLGEEENGLLFAYSADKDIDPWVSMFYAPTDKLKLAVYSLEGEEIWKKVIPSSLNGSWFTPVYPFDLDGDGADEIYYINNEDTTHILNCMAFKLQALDARSGSTLGQWDWQQYVWDESISHMFRNFIMGGYVNDQAVLITAQGTYGKMGLNAWNPSMEHRWELIIPDDGKGPRGSHMSPVIDINADQVDEILWGERCISLDDGSYLFIGDKRKYNGHSDVIQPTLLRDENRWNIFTCRETGEKGEIKPRVVMFDEQGKRLWTDLDEGHMDMGWTAHLNTDSLQVLAFTISRGDKKAGPQGFYRFDIKEYTYNGRTGERVSLPFKAYNTIPSDLNGDGYHEFVCAFGEQADRKIYDLEGQVIQHLGKDAYLAMASKFMKLPGEQLLCYYPDGTIKIWADNHAKDTETALKRYSHPYYKLAQKLTAVGYNYSNLGGL